FHQRKQPLGPLLCKDLVYVPALQSHPACRRESLFKTAGHIPSSLRSEEHTSELQSRENLVCRLLLEKKNDSGLIIHDYTVNHLQKHVAHSLLPGAAVNVLILNLLRQRSPGLNNSAAKASSAVFQTHV